MSGSSSPNGTSAGACARCVGVATTAGVRVLSVGQATGRGEPPLLPDSVETAASAALELVREVLLLRVGVPSRISLNDTSSDMPAEAKRSGCARRRCRSARTFAGGGGASADDSGTCRRTLCQTEALKQTTASSTGLSRALSLSFHCQLS